MKIRELTLFTDRLKEQKHFYGEVLGFACVEESTDHIAFRAGASRLVFSRAGATEPVHFAFIIPGNSYEQAREWLSARVEHLPFEGDDIIDFPNWNAKAQYFYDADKNIVEFIARRDVDAHLEGTFSADAIVRIGEVGLPSADPESLYEELNSLCPLPQYSGDFKRFGAAGSPEGLFILVNPLEKDWFPTGDKVKPAHVMVRGDHNFEFKNEQLISIK